MLSAAYLSKMMSPAARKKPRYGEAGVFVVLQRERRREWGRRRRCWPDVPRMLAQRSCRSQEEDGEVMRNELNKYKLNSSFSFALGLRCSDVDVAGLMMCVVNGSG